MIWYALVGREMVCAAVGFELLSVSDLWLENWERDLLCDLAVLPL